MKTLIVYATKHGATEKCAKLLAKKLDGSVDLCNLKRDKTPNPESYDKVIIGGPVYIGKILTEVSGFCKRNLEILKSKKVGLYICGMREGEVAQEEINTSFPAELLRMAAAKECFGGEFILGKMNFMERFIVKKVAKTNKDISNILDENIKKFALSINSLDR
jgi:menaquinone-dependent protoporphyrinogen oxidase